MSSNAVESLLIRLKLAEAIPKFKEMKVDRIVNLRRLREEDLREAVPDEEKRQQLIIAISSRGTHEKRGNQPPPNMNPPRNADDGGRGSMRAFPQAGMRGGGGGMGGGMGGGGMGRGMGRGSGDRGGHGGSAFGARQNRVCHHFFKGECKYGDKCHFSHDKDHLDKEQADGVPPRPAEAVGNSKDYSEVCEIPTSRIKFLLGNKAERLKEIHHECHTHNQPFTYVNDTIEKFELIVYGSDRQSVLQAKNLILAYAGVKRAEEQKNRMWYTINELNNNQRAAGLLAACNIKNEESPNVLSEHSLKTIISSFRFEKQQDIRHFWVNTSNDRHKMEVIAKIVAQLRGVQAIMFCEQKRVVEMSKASTKIARHFNGVNPIFIHRALSKEERMGLLEDFKTGEQNDNGIRERLMVTSEDYAKLARKTLIPYVNLVINYSVPRSEEFYLLQSLVAGRNDSVGVSILLVSPYEQSTFHDLQQKVTFEALDEEANFTDTAVQMMYDTVANPLTSEDADPPKNWREKINQPKEGAAK